MSPPEGALEARLSLWQAVALGVLQGPAELLPISSSAHISALPWLLGWGYSELDGSARKSFEVALHMGTAAAMVLSGDDRMGRLDLVAAASLPPAVAGYLLENLIEERLGTPATVAVGLAAGSAAMVIADRAPQRRRYREARVNDGLGLGVAQAAALIPGVSRHGATIAAARLRGFRRPDAYRLSQLVGLAPIGGATALRVIRSPPDRGAMGPVALGAASSFISTRACLRLAPRRAALWPFALYRGILAGAIVWRLRRGSRAGRTAPARP